MAQSTLTQIAQSKTSLDLEFLSRKSTTWLQNNIKDIRTSPIKLAKEISQERNRATGRFQMGGLYHFFYDPLGKGDLPYYDIFPLVIPLSRDAEGFLGMNMHYLPPSYRAAFMDKLMNFALTNEQDEPKRIRVTYDILRTARNLREFKPCIKRYLNSQVRSKILTIQPHEWETALFLPTAVFRGAPINKVYSESVKKINNRVY